MPTRVLYKRVLKDRSQSFTGRHLIQILIDSKIKPIALITPTNHALDHVLNSILDARITKKIVRLGSQSTDERIAKYNLKNLMDSLTDDPMSLQIWTEYAAKRRIEEEMLQVMENIQISEPSEVQVKEYLRMDWAEHLSMMYEPPFWITEYAARLWASSEKGKERSHPMTHAYYEFWKHGLDIDLIRPPRFGSSERREENLGGQDVQPGVLVPPSQEEEEKRQKWRLKFFSDLGYGDLIPPVPISNRSIFQLRESPAVWEMSLEERQRLVQHWEEEMRRLAYNTHLREYRKLRKLYEDAHRKYEAVSEEVMVRV